MAQTLDTVVQFPSDPFYLFHVPVGNKLYVTVFMRDSNTYHIHILDCASMAVRRVIRTGTLPDQNRAAWGWRHNKVYMNFNWGADDSSVLAVIDNATDSVFLRLPFGVVNRAITVLDCAADTVLARIEPADCEPWWFAVWDSAGDKVYFGCAGWSNADRIAVVDCRSDSVVALISTGIGWPAVVVYNPLRRKLYVGGEGSLGVAVIDCVADTVVSRLDLWSDYFRLPVYCSAEDKVYWPSYGGSSRTDTLFVVSCSGDSIVRRILAPGGGSIWCCAYATWSNRLYVVSSYPYSNLLTVFDCRTDSIIGQTRFGACACEIVCNSVDHRIYVLDNGDSALYVFREDLQPVAEEPEHGSGGLTIRVWPNPARDWLWVRGPGQLILYSASGQRRLALVPGRNRLPDNLAPGVYFVREASGVKREASSVHKVVIAR
jgi:DNA-binding beta-propeller fold protein YncE